MELSSLKLSPKKAGMGGWEVNLTFPPCGFSKNISSKEG